MRTWGGQSAEPGRFSKYGWRDSPGLTQLIIIALKCTSHLGFSLVTAGGDVIAKSARGYEQKGECLVSIGLVKLASNDLIRDLGKLDPTGEA